MLLLQKQLVQKRSLHVVPPEPTPEGADQIIQSDASGATVPSWESHLVEV